jgi:hypothetical protein
VRIIDGLRGRRSTAGGPRDTQLGSETGLPIPGYDRLSDKEVAAQLHELTQVELAAVDAHERSGRNRPAVLDKLRYMRGEEPFPGYDALDTGEIARRVADSDAQTVRSVRDYERKFRGRREVSDAVTRHLPRAFASTAEVDAREQKAERTRAGIRSRPGG